MCQEYQISGPWIPYVLAILAVVLGLLEVSLVRYRSFKDVDMRNKVPFYIIFLSVLLLVLIAYNPPVVLSLLCFLYALSGPLHWLWRKQRSRYKRKRR
jgi:CDP-diacylglycerol---serine O-phosphatidyltransferase